LRVRETQRNVRPDDGGGGAGAALGHGHVHPAPGDAPLHQAAELGLVPGEASGKLDARLKEPVVEGAGLSDEDGAHTPGFTAPVTRHADDQAHVSSPDASRCRLGVSNPACTALFRHTFR
jgi:hypothetical protein